MMKNKRFWYSSALLLTAGVLAACGGAEEDNGGGEEAEAPTEEATIDESDIPEEPESLHLWVNNDDVQLDAYEEITQRFTEEYGIEIEITPYDMLDATEGISLDGPAGQGPDLFFQPHDRVGDIHLQGLAAELEFTEDQLERLGEYNEEAVQSFSYDGIQYGIPAVVETYGLFVNTELVPEAPETTDELIEIAQDLTSGEQYGFMMNAGDFYFMHPFLTADGGYIFAQDDEGVYDTSDIGIDTPEAIESAEFVQSWFEEGLMPEGVDLDVASSLFSDGNLGMIVDGPWAIPEYRESLGDNLQVAELPTHNNEPLQSFSGNKGWLVNYYSENQYWATELALFITNEESSQTYFETAGELPAHLAVEINDEFMEPIFDQTLNAVPMPNVPEMTQVWDPMADALQFIQQGEDVEEVLTEAAQQIQSDIEMMGQ